MAAAEHTIDLHGFSRAQALRELQAKMTYYRAGRVSLVRVITGRGEHSVDGQAVLAPAVRSWLEGPEGRSLGVVRCQPQDRGGSLLVHLKT